MSDFDFGYTNRSNREYTPEPDTWEMPDGTNPWAVVIYDEDGVELDRLFSVPHRYQAKAAADGLNDMLPSGEAAYADVDLNEGAELDPRSPPATMTEQGPWW